MLSYRHILCSLILCATFLCGCIEQEYSSGPDVIIYKTETSVENGLFKMIFHLKNIGNEEATMIYMLVNVENQDGETRINRFVYPCQTLQPGETCTEIESIKIWHNEEKYYADIEVHWMGGEHMYNYVWNIE